MPTPTQTPTQSSSQSSPPQPTSTSPQTTLATPRFTPAKLSDAKAGKPIRKAPVPGCDGGLSGGSAPAPMLTFDPQWHAYRFRGRKLFSVTSLLKKFAKPFDAETIATRVAIRDGCSPGEVLEQWEAKRDRAANLGTAVHEYAEFRASSFWAPDEDVARGFVDFDTSKAAAHESARLLPFFLAVDAAYRRYNIRPVVSPRYGQCVERMVCWPDFSLAGTIDLIATTGGDAGDVAADSSDDSSGGLPWILDWKTNERIDRSNGFGDKMLAPLDHLPDCNFYHYAMQLSIYRHVLEEFYGETFAGQALIHLAPGAKAGADADRAHGFEMIPVPYLRDEAAEVVAEHHRRTFDWFC